MLTPNCDLNVKCSGVGFNDTGTARDVQILV